MSELKPCPFCGSPGKFYCGERYVMCSNDDCECGTCDWYKVNEWNTRPIEDALRAEIADLKYQLRPTSCYCKECAEHQAEIDRLKHQIANLEQQLYFKNLPSVGVEG